MTGASSRGCRGDTSSSALTTASRMGACMASAIEGASTSSTSRPQARRSSRNSQWPLPGIRLAWTSTRRPIASDHQRYGPEFRHNVNTGGTTIVDTALSYTAGVTATGLAGAAYVNDNLDATTGTTLFDIDASLDQVAIQSPPMRARWSRPGA